MFLEEKESTQFSLIKNLKFRFWVYNILIPFTLVAFLYCSYLSYQSIKEHKVMVQYEPARSGILLEYYNLEKRKIELSRVLNFNKTSDNMFIEWSLIFEKLDSIKISEEYKNDSTVFAQSSLAFLKIENKLSLKFLLQVFGAIAGAFAFVWLAKAYYQSDFKDEN